MLPEIQLDKDRFEHMTREMQNMISSMYPAWTDYNAHDPGITLMELFAWLQEIQQYHMDQIGYGQMTQYLKLLGQNRRGRRPAEALLFLESPQPLTVKKNSRFYVEDFCFETERELTLPGIRTEFAVCQEPDGSFMIVEREQLAHDGQMEFRPFGRHLKAGTVCYLGMSAPLPQKKETALSIRVSRAWPVPRNRVEGEFLPLADLAYEYFAGEETGWQPLEVIRDESYGFLQDGFLVVSCDGPMEPVEIAGRRAYGLRILLKDSGYEVPPVVTGMNFCYVPALQKHTRARMLPAKLVAGRNGLEVYVKEPLLEEERAECWFGVQGRYQPAVCTCQLQDGYAVFSAPSYDGEMPDETLVLAYEQTFEKERCLPDGDGFPYQKISLKEQQLLAEDFLLLAEDQEHPGFLNFWSRVDNFHESGPEDRHYILDGENGWLIFGDGFTGMAPEGRLLIASYAVSAGKAGNINPAVFTAPEYPELSAISRLDAKGGEDPESFEEAFRRFERSQNDIFQAVTLADYEALTMRTPGLMLYSCRAIASSFDEITVAVMPFSEHGTGILSARAAENIRHYLEKRRLIGTAIHVKSPEYVQVAVTVQIYLKPQYRDGRQTAEDTVRKFFDQIHGRMGETLSYRSLCGRLERLACTAKIGYLTLEARGSGFTYGENGDLLPTPDGVFVLKDLVCVALEV